MKINNAEYCSSLSTFGNGFKTVSYRFIIALSASICSLIQIENVFLFVFNSSSHLQTSLFKILPQDSAVHQNKTKQTREREREKKKKGKKLRIQKKYFHHNLSVSFSLSLSLSLCACVCFRRSSSRCLQ